MNVLWTDNQNTQREEAAVMAVAINFYYSKKPKFIYIDERINLLNLINLNRYERNHQ